MFESEEETSSEFDPLLGNEQILPTSASTSSPKEWHRWIALCLMCLVSLGSCYCYDNPAALHDAIVNELKISNTVFTSFYSWYNWPNVLLCLFGGILIDWLGRRYSVCLFSFIVLCGQLTFALGALCTRVHLMQLGRVIFGIGGESLGTVTNTFLASWFLNKELNFAFGFMLSFTRMGSSLNMYLTRPLYDALDKYYHGSHLVGLTLLILVSACAVSFIAASALALLDRHRDRTTRANDGNRQRSSNSRTNLSLIFQLPVQLYLLTLVIVCFYVAVFPFISIGVKFFELRYDMSAKMAGFLDSCVFISSAMLAPIVGAVVDKIGRNLTFLSCAIVGTILSHSLMAFTFIPPVIPMVMFGLSYTVMTAFLWPLIVLIVPQANIGTAYGLTFSIQNLGMALMNMSSGYIIDHYGFFILQILMISLLLYALMFNVFLIRLNEAKGGILNMSAAQRKALTKK